MKFVNVRLTIIFNVIVSDVFEDMKRSVVLPRVCKSHDVLKLKVGLDIVSVYEEFDFVDEMGCGFVECCCNHVNVLLNCENAQEEPIQSNIKLGREVTRSNNALDWLECEK